MKIRNNNIYMTRGETCGLTVRAWNEDGTPLILPPVEKRTLKAIATKIGNRYQFHTPIPPSTLNESRSLFVQTAESAGTITVWLDGAKEIVKVTSNITRIALGVVNCVTAIETALTIGSIIAVVDTADAEDIYYADSDCIVSALAFTVRAADSDSIVLEKYLNLQSPIGGDYTQYGWAKFTSQDIIHGTSVDELLETLTSDKNSGKVSVGKVKNDYLHMIQKVDGSYTLAPYEFAVDIPLLHEDTAGIQASDLVYDVILYQGYVSDFEKDGFPFDKVVWKREIISPHKLVLGGSNND